MIKRRHLAVLLCASAALLLAACKSAPKAEEKKATPAQEQPKKEEPVTDGTKKNDYSDANSALMQKVVAARDEAIAAGAEAANPVGYKAAEAEYETEKAASSDGSTDLSVALNDLIARYNAMTAYANAKAKKERIDSLDFAGYDQSDYNEGSAILEELSGATANIATGKDLNKKASQADRQLGAVLTAGYKALAKSERTAAYNAKVQADSVKAAVSHKDEYNKAVETFRLGDQNYVTGSPDASVENYKSAKETFTNLYNTIKDARAKAQAKIEEAKKRVADSNAVAAEADATAPLGDEKVQGIEDPNAKLLEDDDFSSAGTAADVDETLSEGAPEK